ncbi:MAG: SDR family oxidoreductase [Bacteroidales bacterium]|jgi:3-oxoacyl-[acyl-carrier protein] reductase|nr:SDR family oxidoreductase [Bacteroidales bacterium]
MATNIDLREKTALVTGGTMGIGAAIASELHKAGADLIITGVEKISIIEELNENKRKEGINNVQYINVDFANNDSIDNFFNFLDAQNKIDICINNAGTNRNNLIDEINTKDFDLLLDVNLKAPFLITRFLSKKMKEANYGRIVNIASIWSIKSRPGRAAYTISKSGIVGLTKTSSIELAPNNILVNAVSPGFTMTELTMKTLPEKEFKELESLVPLKRFAQPEEIAKLVLFLVSDLNTYITGQNIAIDGGYKNV